MPLLNYTTTVAATRTAAEMTHRLAVKGASQIMTTYDAGRPTGLAFAMPTAHGLRRFTLPVNVERVYKVLSRDRQVPPRYKSEEQAERVAWRIVKDWLEAQLAITETEMVTLDQVMLPYMQGDDGRTIWELYLDQQLALGTAGGDG